jgi:hypothetical protein
MLGHVSRQLFATLARRLGWNGWLEMFGPKMRRAKGNERRLASQGIRRDGSLVSVHFCAPDQCVTSRVDMQDMVVAAPPTAMMILGSKLRSEASKPRRNVDAKHRTRNGHAIGRFEHSQQESHKSMGTWCVRASWRGFILGEVAERMRSRMFEIRSPIKSYV